MDQTSASNAANGTANLGTQVRKNKNTSQRRALARGDKSPSNIHANNARDEALLYLRVSTDASAESNLSIPDQQKKLLKWCEENGKLARKIYVDKGLSAFLDVRRPEFDEMVADLRSGRYPQVGYVVIYATSRLFRRAHKFGKLEQELNALGIEVISITQSFAKDAGGFVAKQVSMTFDEYHSIVTSVNVRRAQREMVDQAYWPGGVVRHGFKLVPAMENARRNRVVVDEVDMAFVKKVFELAEFGNGTGPMGIKAIVNWATENNCLTRNGSPFSIAAIHRMLTFEGYTGSYPYGVDESPSPYSPAYPVKYLKVEPIIPRDQFERVQQLLERRDPRMHAAKAVSSPLLLSGVALCKCGSALTLGTGTSKTGRLYRYYRCSRNNRLGSGGCPGIRIPEEVLDEAVMTSVAEKILAPDHLSELFEGLFDRREKECADRDTKLPALLAREKECKAALHWLFATAKTVPGVSEDSVFKADLANALRAAKLVESELNRAKTISTAERKVTPDQIYAFANEVRETLLGENRAVAKQVLQSIVSLVEVTDETIRIVGDNEQLSRLVSDPENDPDEGDSEGGSGVRRYIRRWRRECPPYTSELSR
ncbi:recombinase family protein [Bradyrhizobium sp. LTSPM299]|uniref:recombinase family protein n=1 Tax=Bradyrhizobium sp. LTSPM299 TaxID=1619233 RepID=UPI0009E238E7|nr:recombinase family protein [Bradyrhizobium sp. LTSPM299]